MPISDELLRSNVDPRLPWNGKVQALGEPAIVEPFRRIQSARLRDG